MSSPNTSSLQNPNTNHSFMSKHKKKFIIAVVSAITIAALYFAYTNGYISPELISKSKELLYSIGQKFLETTKYSVNFFKENLIISSIVTVIAVLITYFTYQAYKKRSQEKEQERKIDSIIDDLSKAFNDFRAKIPYIQNNVAKINQSMLIDSQNQITELGGALLNLIKKYDQITPDILSNKKLNKALNDLQNKNITISITYEDKNNKECNILINPDNFKILEYKKDEETILHLPKIIAKLKPLKNILVPSNEVNLNSAEKQEKNNAPHL